MKTTVSSFATLIARDYGDTVASQFFRRFPHADQELTFRQAMEILDDVLMGDSAPAMPHSGATDSVPSKVTLVIKW